MKIAVIGSRDFRDAILMQQVLDDLVAKHLPNVVIVSRGACGADEMAEDYARINGIPCVICSADWEQHGQEAGAIRNDALIRMVDICVAFWNGESRGTRHAIDLCRKHYVGVTIIPTKVNLAKVNSVTGKRLPCECT